MSEKTTVFVCDCEKTIPLDRKALADRLRRLWIGVRRNLHRSAEFHLDDAVRLGAGRGRRLIRASDLVLAA